MHHGSRRMRLPTILAVALLAGCQAGDGTDEGVEPDTLAAEDTLAARQGSLYDRLGGEPAIASVVDSLVVYGRDARRPVSPVAPWDKEDM